MKYKLYKEGRSPDKYTSFILFDEFGVDNVKIELIENYSCENREILRKREGEYIRSECCVNKHFPNRTKSEYYHTHKEQQRQYVLEHREERNAYNKTYRIKHKENIQERAKEQIQCHVCNCTVSRRNKAMHEKSLKHQNALLELETSDQQQQNFLSSL